MKKFKTVIYCRLSQEDGDKEESNSITSQRRMCEEFVSKQEDMILCRDTIIDDGVSGVSLDRAGFRELEKEIMAGNVECVVVKDLSRFARNYIEAGRYLEKIFPQYGVRFIAINDNYDSHSAEYYTNSLLVPFKNLINDSYSKDISLKVRSSLEIKMKNGEFVGSFAPYGYIKNPDNHNQLLIDKNVSSNVVLIFSLFKEGYSIEEIAKRLNEFKILTPFHYKKDQGQSMSAGFQASNDSEWSYQMVRRVLANEVYTGTLVQGKRKKPNYKVKEISCIDEENWTRVEDCHEPIISMMDFRLVREHLKKDLRILHTGENNALSGMIHCADCGSIMHRRMVNSRGKKYYYYICSTHKKYKTCSSHNIPVKTIEKTVLSAIQSQVNLFVELKEVMEQMNEVESVCNIKKKAFTKQIEQLENNKAKILENKMSLYESYTSRLLDVREYKEYKGLYDKKILEVDNTIRAVEMEIKLLQDTQESEDWFNSYLEFHNITELNRRVLMTMVDRIKIFEGHNLEVVFKYKNQIEPLLEFVKKEGEVSGKKK